MALNYNARISAAELARLVGVTPSRISQLVAKGALPGPEALTLSGGVRAFIRARDEDRRSTQQSAAAARLQDARARGVELRNARLDGRLIDLEEHRQILTEVVAAWREGLETMPARASRDLDQRAKLEEAVNETFKVIAGYLAKAGGFAAPGAPDVPPDPEGSASGPPA